MIKKLYIAYGSNLNMAQMAYRCPDAVPLASAVLKDCKLTFRGNSHTGVANVERSRGGIVPIGIWSISENDEINLDRYEGYPHLYTKDYVNVVLDGEKMKGLIYIMTKGHAEQMPSEYYADVIREGYYDFGIDTKYLDKAIENCKRFAGA